MYHIHPLIVSPALEGKDNKACSPLSRLPFPLIDLNWEGFTTSYLPWVGIKTTKPTQRAKHIRLARMHEACHQGLALTPFSLFKKSQAYKLYRMILGVFIGRKEQITVPLTADQSGNVLQQQWFAFNSLTQATAIVEEVYAVRMSVSVARKTGQITDAGWLDGVVSSCKVGYNGMIDHFERGYNAFDYLAGKIGDEAAQALIFHTFKTLHPHIAFWDIINAMSYLDTIDSRPFLGFQLSIYDWLNVIMAFFDPEDEIYQRKNMVKIRPWIEQELNWWVQNFDGFSHINSDLPRDFLYSEYTDTFQMFCRVDTSTGRIDGKVGRGPYLSLILEAILQQLIAGIGLLCPLWGRLPNNYPYDCCQMRSLFEGVWECIVPDRSQCQLWQRMGCLAKEPTMPIDRYAD